MLRNNKGFSLIEVLVSMGILMILSSVMIPSIIHIYKERLTIREEQQALELLQNHIAVQRQNDDQINISVPAPYAMSTQTIHGNKKLCISWKGENGRHYQTCGFIDNS